MSSTALTLSLLLAAGAPSAPAADAPPPAPQALLAEAKAAAGGEAWDRVKTLRTKGTVKTSGLSGSGVTLDDLVNGRTLDRMQLGPIRQAQGFDGKTVWTQDTSGQVREEAGGDTRLGAIDDAYRRRVAYWYPARAAARIEARGVERVDGRALHVLTLTPEGGRPFDLWIDAATHLVDRVVEKMALETRTTLFSDYRRVEGVLLPFRIRSTNGEEKYDQLIEVTGVEVNVPVKDADFAMPAPPPPDFAFSGGKTSTTVPFQLVNNHIYLDVTLNGQGPFRLLCDTGGANIVTPTLAKALGLPTAGALQGRGVGEASEDVALTEVKALGIGDVTLRDQLFMVFAMEPFAAVEGVPILGLIGYEVFKRFVVEVSYGKSRLTLTLPAAFQGAAKGTAVPFVFNDHIPQVEGEIDGVPGKFDIDTGSRSSVDLLGPFAEQHGLATKYRLTPSVVTGWGVGGASYGRVTRARVLKLGAVTVKEPVAIVSSQKKGAFSDPYVAGNVGGGVLRRFDVTFDYAGKRMWFEPNAQDALPDAYDRAGLWVNLDGPAFAVMDVLEGGPAHQAGVRVGDRILSVDGAPVTKTTLAEFRALLRTRTPGKAVNLVVEAAGKPRPAKVVLRDLTP
ncbi:MAG: aspartyl protease family protein [Anaeromyxobacteraceae bacterium]